jgi:SpoVK/Ycf46/Vps4 family AAA+-type ATPase
MKTSGKETVIDEIGDVDKDLASLARLASTESYEDVRMLLAKLVRKYRHTRPQLAAMLDQSLKGAQTRSAHPSVLRRADIPESFLSPASAPVDSDSRLSLIRTYDDRAGFPVPLLSPSLERQLDAIVQERREREKLLQRGILPTRSAILVGPPGVGKTHSARWLASRLGQPLWVLDLTAVMSSFLGRTGNNLRAALDHAKENSAILLLDEIDGIAKRRGDESDIGELKRLVTVILQEVDQWPDNGLLLAATNHPELVDPALWRRFEAVLQFDLPDAAATSTAVKRFLADDQSHFVPWLDKLSAGFRGKSLSDVQRAITGLRRSFALRHGDPEKLVSELFDHTFTKSERLELAVVLAKSGEYSHQAISEITGVARDTIRKHAGPSPRRGRGLKK